MCRRLTGGPLAYHIIPYLPGMCVNAMVTETCSKSMQSFGDYSVIPWFCLSSREPKGGILKYFLFLS